MIETILFYFFAALTLTSAAGVVLNRNIVRSAVSLLGALVGVAGLYFLLNAEFLAAVQLVIYVGGTLILIIFGVMLTSKSPFAHLEATGKETMFALLIGAVLLTALITAILHTPWTRASDSNLRYPIESLGQALLGDYLVPFELASVLLLVVMIGAAYLAKARRHEEGE